MCHTLTHHGPLTPYGDKQKPSPVARDPIWGRKTIDFDTFQAMLSKKPLGRDELTQTQPFDHSNKIDTLKK